MRKDVFEEVLPMVERELTQRAIMDMMETVPDFAPMVEFGYNQDKLANSEWAKFIEMAQDMDEFHYYADEDEEEIEEYPDFDFETMRKPKRGHRTHAERRHDDVMAKVSRKRRNDIIAANKRKAMHEKPKYANSKSNHSDFSLEIDEGFEEYVPSAESFQIRSKLYDLEYYRETVLEDISHAIYKREKIALELMALQKALTSWEKYYAYNIADLKKVEKEIAELKSLQH